MANPNLWIEIQSDQGKDFILISQIIGIRLYSTPPKCCIEICWGDWGTIQDFPDHVSAEKAYAALKSQIGG